MQLLYSPPSKKKKELSLSCKIDLADTFPERRPVLKVICPSTVARQSTSNYNRLTFLSIRAFDTVAQSTVTNSAHELTVAALLTNRCVVIDRLAGDRGDKGQGTGV